MATASSATKQLNCYEFGRRLIESKDLDPVYIAVWEAQLEPIQLRRWLIPYWNFYHVGTASWIADGVGWVGYWARMRAAAASKDYPRSRERRHFRGETARKAVAYQQAHGVDGLLGPLLDGQPHTAPKVIDHVKTWYGFGPWISFKVADMLEALNICPVRFDADTCMYEGSPLEGAKLLWEAEGTPLEGGFGGHGAWAMNRLLAELGDLKAPPRYQRCVSFAEMETVCCKHKSYTTGHYHLGEDITATRTGLEQFKSTPTAQRLLVGGHKGGLW